MCFFHVFFWQLPGTCVSRAPCCCFPPGALWALLLPHCPHALCPQEARTAAEEHGSLDLTQLCFHRQEVQIVFPL